MDPNCIFCKIINKEAPSDIVFEDDKVLAFLDIRPAAFGHTLVVPKKHSTDLLDSDDETLADLIVKIKKIAQAVVSGVNAAGFNLGLNDKAAAGQVVSHMHFHILPRFLDDGLKLWPQKDSEPKSRKETAERIRKNL